MYELFFAKDGSELTAGVNLCKLCIFMCVLII